MATGSVADGDETATDDGDASYTVAPLIPTVTTSKNIEPGDITAGQSAEATISGTNGDVPVTSMTMSDLDFFTEDITFGGFTEAPSWPDDATGATIT